ncbi:hypothetical protein LO772_03625 [Yinghuangia sp. ASG 101]|uniref:hypothetical protein n=1 Tax=Yinghuangia sp. ASG 101 TaxID=2896848 RepID=UPI001E472042|nr:hypothetical protein [Yinghuangia sp. ASG 101]UGQ12723.1 hypothetical protein LO772_03625 [Yinghuangia sp. ASG 101]
MTAGRFEVRRKFSVAPEAVFAVLRDPRGHVAIDSSGMPQSAEGGVVGKARDEFVVHMDREALNARPTPGVVSVLPSGWTGGR